MITADNNSNIPCLISFEVHVEQMWTVDLQDCHERALDLISSSNSRGEDDEDGDGATSLSTGAGLLVVIQLKSFSADAIASRLASRTEEERRDAESLQQELDARRARMAAGHVDVLGELDADEDDDDGDFSRVSAELRNKRRREEELVSVLTKKVLQFNPMSRSLPLVSNDGSIGSLGGEAKESLNLALVVPSSSKSSQDMARAITAWRNSLRLHDLPDHKGADNVPLPPTILRSFALYMDHMHREGALGGNGTSPGIGNTYRMGPSLLAKTVLSASIPVHMGSVDVLGQGYNSLRSVHALNESRRLTASREDNSGDREHEDVDKNKAQSESKYQPKPYRDHLQGFSSLSLKQAAITAMQLVVVCGLGGSGTTLIGEQLADRIDRSLKKTIKMLVQLCQRPR